MNIVRDVRIVEKFREDMRGVFTLSDLKGILPSKHLNAFYRRVTNLQKTQVLQRFTRGIYVTKKFDLSVVSQKICQRSYISFETVLAKNLVIGTIPKHEVKAIKVGKRREYKSQHGVVTHLGIAKHLYFGFETKNGVNFATKEKALLDTLYFHNKGMSFYFDIYSDVDLTNIDKAVVNKFLANYKNPKFIKFVHQYFEAGVL